MLFDTHAHYYDKAFDPDRDALLSALPERGVELVVCPGCDLESSRASVALAERYDYLYAAAGYHPENLEGVALADLDALLPLLAHEKVKAVGEIGLDYYWVKTPEARAFSRDMFDAQLSLAEELDLPAIVHDRDAHKDCLDMVRAHPKARGVFHCCAVSLEDAKVLLDRGVDALLHGEHHLPQRQAGPGGGPLDAPGPADAGDRRPLYGPGAPSGPAVRFHPDSLHRRQGGPAEGEFHRGNFAHYPGKRETIFQFVRRIPRYDDHFLRVRGLPVCKPDQPL